jgi:competence protein ComEA
MLKKLLGALLALLAAGAFAAVDVNKADQAALESVKGIGPAISTKILDERKKGAFKDWNDLIERVKGVGEGNAAKFSTEGLTVNGAAFSGAPAATHAKAPAKASKKEEKAAAQSDESAKPMAAASEPKAEKKSAAEKRAEKRAEKKAAKEAADKPTAAASGAKK